MKRSAGIAAAGLLAVVVSVALFAVWLDAGQGGGDDDGWLFDDVHLPVEQHPCDVLTGSARLRSELGVTGSTPAVTTFASICTITGTHGEAELIVVPVTGGLSTSMRAADCRPLPLARGRACTLEHPIPTDDHRRGAGLLVTTGSSDVTLSVAGPVSREALAEMAAAVVRQVR